MSHPSLISTSHHDMPRQKNGVKRRYKMSSKGEWKVWLG